MVFLMYYFIMKKFRYFIIILIILFFSTLLIMAYNNTLYCKLNRFIKAQDAQIGVAVIKDKNSWIINNKKFPLLSVFKYFIALKVLEASDNGEAFLNKEITITKDMVDEKLYSPMLEKYKSFPFQIKISDLLRYMISQSDNNACDILIDYSGGIRELESYIHDKGYGAIEIQVNEKQMNEDIEKQYLNKAYPIDVIKLMKYVREDKFLLKDSKHFLNEIMINTTTGENKLKAGIPQNIVIGHKTGSSSRKIDGTKIADNDAGFVILPNGNVYYIAVMIENSKLSDTENANIISTLSEIVYEYFSKQ